ncbi:MAG: transglutaminase domain-containing protein [Clostridia bacterium]|nr:transglutaminase domain-containing protein [Clostridia bacterium]
MSKNLFFRYGKRVISCVLALSCLSGISAFADETAYIQSTGSVYGRTVISWQTEPGAESYIVEKSDFSGNNYFKVAEVNETYFTDEACEDGITYFYRISAVGKEEPELNDITEESASDIKEGFVFENNRLSFYFNNEPVKNRTIYGFRFDKDGFYTSGNTELDGVISKLIAEHTTEEMTALQKFNALYQWVGENMFYCGSEIHAAGDTGWETETALKALTDMRGNCYYYAAPVVMIGRALGFDCKGVCGFFFYPTNDVTVPHGWCELKDENGNVFVCDTEMENVFGKNRDLEWNLFMTTYEEAPLQYMFEDGDPDWERFEDKKESEESSK